MFAEAGLLQIDLPPTATLALICLGVAGSTLCGGALALAFRQRIHLILGFIYGVARLTAAQG